MTVYFNNGMVSKNVHPECVARLKRMNHQEHPNVQINQITDEKYDPTKICGTCGETKPMSFY